MGFKVNSSFLRFLTMGAKGVHQTITQLEEMGFNPIELERYCGSNKIWETKVKRLRLPDLLCVKTGLRVEVRAKSDLAIKMSDAPSNQDRRWDSGLRDEDLVAFIACFDIKDSPVIADQAIFVRVGDMRESVDMSKLGAPKSASEGAERDREWPTTVPKRDGEIIQITDEKIVTRLFATDQKGERKQTFPLNRKIPYFSKGDRFEARTCFLSGAPKRLANLSEYLSQSFNPFEAILSDNDIDRYSAVKSFPYRDDNRNSVLRSLEKNMAVEQEPRVRLEAAGSGAFYGSNHAQKIITDFIWGDDMQHELRMEAVLILIERPIRGFTKDVLRKIASKDRFKGNELRQVAIWGLGKAGVKSYKDVLPFIADEEENVALHAIAAFDECAPVKVIDKLVRYLLSGDQKYAPAASEVLRIIDSEMAISHLINAYDQNENGRSWIIATLGRMSPNKVTGQIGNHEVMKYLEPMFLYANGAHWLSSEEMTTNMSFLLKQNIYGL